MKRLFLLVAILNGCIGDDGKIDETCDEIPEPCHWEQKNPSNSTDTGGDDTAR